MFPLEGIRVAEFAGILAGPWAGQMLSDLGADVVKVEPPRGDDTRKWGPPFVSEAAGGDAAYFHCCNRGKRSAVADLKTESGREFARRLVSRADVMLENFRPGAAARNGLDWESVSAANPRLIVCAISGFGKTGPLASAPGYDLVIQAASGLMDITGDAEGGPRKVGVAFADIFTGVYAVSAIQAALRAREATGRGCFIDMALLDSLCGVLANQAMNFLSSGESPRRMGNAHPNIAPYESFPAQDGAIVIAAGNDSQYERLRKVLDLPERDDFRTNALRVKNRAALAETISERTRGTGRDVLLGLLSGAGVPCGPVNTVGEALTSEQILSRGMVLDFDGGEIRGMRTPITFSNLDLNLRRPSPRLGEHQEEVEREIGMGEWNAKTKGAKK